MNEQTKVILDQLITAVREKEALMRASGVWDSTNSRILQDLQNAVEEISRIIYHSCNYPFTQSSGICPICGLAWKIRSTAQEDLGD